MCGLHDNCCIKCGSVYGIDETIVKLDKYGILITEQNPEGDPGNLGDSCCYTSGLDIVAAAPPVLSLFMTPKGFIRHPDSLWREDDFSSDQALPLLIASDLRPNLDVADRLRNSLIENGYKTGNGKLVSPMLYAVIKKNIFLLKTFLYAQSLIFKIPVRWSDSKNCFESSKTSSADYLNYIHAALYAKKSYVQKEVLKHKLSDYFNKEPNIQWLLDLYFSAIDKSL